MDGLSTFFVVVKVHKTCSIEKWSNMSESNQTMPIIFCVLLQLCLVSILGFILYCINYLPDERSSMQFFVKVSRHTPWHNICRSYLWLTICHVVYRPKSGSLIITRITIPSVLRELQQKELCRDSYEWMSAFINVTLSFSLISHTIYAVGISRQLKSVRSVSRSLKAAPFLLSGSCVHTRLQIRTYAVKRVFKNHFISILHEEVQLICKMVFEERQVSVSELCSFITRLSESTKTGIILIYM